MGRFGAWFKKSDDKEKPPSPSSNPYAQQQASPPAQYDQYHGNQYSPQPSQGPPFGLPAGPRPGGLPGRVATGSSQYPATQYSPDLSQPPPYSAGTPSASATSSPSLGSGYPKEKFGAVDGVGRSRFDAPSAPSYDQSTSLPAQRPGGYGNLDTDGGLFDNYTPPSKRTADPDSAAPGPYLGDGSAQEMTEQEIEDAEIARTKAQIMQTQTDSKDSVFRSLQMARQAKLGLTGLRTDLELQDEKLDHAHRRLNESSQHNEVAKGKIEDLRQANKMFGWTSSSKKDIRAVGGAEMELRHQRERERLKKEQEEMRRQPPSGTAGNRTRVLGAGATDQASRSQFAFEDDDGEQDAVLRETDEMLYELGAEVEDINKLANALNSDLDRSVKKLGQLEESAERANDGIVRNKAALMRAARMD